jgi:hypothetical protein
VEEASGEGAHLGAAHELVLAVVLLVPQLDAEDLHVLWRVRTSRSVLSGGAKPGPSGSGVTPQLSLRG